METQLWEREAISNKWDLPDRVLMVPGFLLFSVHLRYQIAFSRNQHKVKFHIPRYKIEGQRREEIESSADIVVKPDGSRVLVLTTSVGGRKTTMSIEISKPANL